MPRSLPSSPRRDQSRPTLVIIPIVVALLAFAWITELEAGTGPLVVSLHAPNGDPLNAYNLVVDSNVSSPSTYGPSVATVIARFCNTIATRWSTAPPVAWPTTAR